MYLHLTPSGFYDRCRAVLGRCPYGNPIAQTYSRDKGNGKMPIDSKLPIVATGQGRYRNHISRLANINGVRLIDEWEQREATQNKLTYISNNRWNKLNDDAKVEAITQAINKMSKLHGLENVKVEAYVSEPDDYREDTIYINKLFLRQSTQDEALCEAIHAVGHHTEDAEEFINHLNYAPHPSTHPHLYTCSTCQTDAGTGRTGGMYVHTPCKNGLKIEKNPDYVEPKADIYCIHDYEIDWNTKSAEVKNRFNEYMKRYANKSDEFKQSMAEIQAQRLFRTHPEEFSDIERAVIANQVLKQAVIKVDEQLLETALTHGLNPDNQAGEGLVSPEEARLIIKSHQPPLYESMSDETLAKFYLDRETLEEKRRELSPIKFREYEFQQMRKNLNGNIMGVSESKIRKALTNEERLAYAEEGIKVLADIYKYKKLTVNGDSDLLQEIKEKGISWHFGRIYRPSDRLLTPNQFNKLWSKHFGE